MGNQASQLGCTGKVILVDGSIQEFEKPLTVAELMLEHPQQVVVELKIGDQNKPTPLPADRSLELDKFYLMVPLRRGKPAHLSSQEAHNILLKANQVLRSKAMLSSSSSKFLPFFARICPATSQDAYANFPRAKREEREVDEVVYNMEVDQQEWEDHGAQRPDYLSRQFSGRGWKPKLDTIQEKKDEMMRKGPKVATLAGKVVKRIESKGLVWG